MSLLLTLVCSPTSLVVAKRNFSRLAPLTSLCNGKLDLRGFEVMCKISSSLWGGLAIKTCEWNNRRLRELYCTLIFCCFKSYQHGTENFRIPKNWTTIRGGMKWNSVHAHRDIHPACQLFAICMAFCTNYGTAAEWWRVPSLDRRGDCPIAPAALWLFTQINTIHTISWDKWKEDPIFGPTHVCERLLIIWQDVFWCLLWHKLKRGIWYWHNQEST